MRRMTTNVLLIVLALLFIACSGRGARVGVYHHHHGHGPWWGSGYYRDRVIVVPERDLDVEATPLPSGPEDMPDMGMPDVDMGDMGGDW